MLADRALVEEAIIRIAKQKAYRVQRSADAFAGRKLFLIYRSVTGQNDRVEVDLNFLFRMPIAGTAMLEMWQPGELERPRVCVISLLEILLGKVLAFLDRSAAKDLWDLANLPTQARELLASDHFRPWFIALSAILDHPLTKYKLNHIKTRVTDRDVNEQLAPMLIGNKLFKPNVLLEESWSVISHLMRPTENEAKFIDSIVSGVLCPELLFPNNPEESRRVAMHPAILWKMMNVRAHIRKHNEKN